MRFGQYFKERRRAAGMSQHDVAQAMELTTSQFVSAIERGTKQMPITWSRKIAELFKIELESLESALRGEHMRIFERDWKAAMGKHNWRAHGKPRDHTAKTKN